MRAVIPITILAGLLPSATAAQPVCPPKLTAEITRLIARDAQREASDAAAIGDYRPMGYVASGPGYFGSSAVGTACSSQSVRFRESHGIPGCFVAGCQHDYGEAAYRFVMAYNRTLVEAANVHGLTLCEPARPLTRLPSRSRGALPIPIR